MPTADFRKIESVNFIPEFDPLVNQIEQWIELIEHNATNYAWNDNFTIYQALSKLRGTAYTWYTSFIENEPGWSQFTWNLWKSLLRDTFQSSRNTYAIFMDIANHRPENSTSLYEFHFNHLAKINKLRVKFSDADKVSLILGAINDENITTAVEAAGITDPNLLAAYLKNKYTKSTNINNVVNNNKPDNLHQKKIRSSHISSKKSTRSCKCCGSQGHLKQNCRHRNKVCNYCKYVGHIERNCLKKRGNEERGGESRFKLSSQEKNESIKRIKFENYKNKFNKIIFVNKLKHQAFIDFGSDCSLISKNLANHFGLEIKRLDKSVKICGFLGNSAEVHEYIEATVEIDSVELNITLYVLEAEWDTKLLIGRNFTENTNIVYYRIDDNLTFQYRKDFCENIVTGNLTQETRLKLQSILTKHEGCFFQNMKNLKKSHKVTMKIEVTNSSIVKHRPYRVPEADKTVLRNLIQELLEAGIIRKSNSPYASPSFLIDKKDGTKRLVVDFRQINKITKKKASVIPIIEEIIDNLSNCKYFTILDLAAGYHQIPMEEDSVQFTAFATIEGHYEYLRCPFGLCNAPAVFQEMMNDILEPVKKDNIIPYLDDILIPSTTVEQGLNLLDKILELLEQHGLTVKMAKSKFLMTNITYLGYELSYNQISPSKQKIAAVERFPVPKNQHQLRQFLGLIGFFRKFISNFARRTSKLTKLLKKDCTWKWTMEETKIMEEMKNLIISEPVLKIYNPEHKTIVYTDASREGFAGILTQLDGSLEKPVAYYSKQTSQEEKKYHSFELELLAIVRTLERYKYYLQGREFTVITDCNSVKNALSKQSIVPRIARWVLYLQSFSFEIKHKSGQQLQHVDALSRNFNENINKTLQYEVALVSEVDYLREAQEVDKEIKRIKDILSSGDQDNHTDIFKQFDLRGDKVYRITDYGKKIYVPKNCRWQIVKNNHDDIGHFAMDKTLDRIKERHWFPKMRRYVKKYISACIPCLYHKHPGGKKPGYLHSIPKYARPHHTLHIDHLGPFVQTRNGNKYLLVTIDAFTKFVFLSAVPDTSTKFVLEALNQIFKIFGNPKRLITDAGKAFVSKDFHKYSEERGIRVFTTAVGMARGNGQVERANKTVLDALATMGARLNTDQWDENLKNIQQGINSTKHRITETTPSEILLGYKMRLDGDRHISDDDSESIDVTKLRKEVTKKLEDNREKQNEHFNKKRSPSIQYVVGDLVLTKTTSFPANNNESKKLLEKYRGPFRIIEVLPNDRYRVKENIHSTRTKRPYEAVVGAEHIKLFKFQKQ